MKKSNILFIVILISSISFNAISQQVIAIVDYMKVAQGNVDNYLEVEKNWKKIHEIRKQEGIITNWRVFQIMFTGTNDEYNYATVTYFNDFGKYENSMSEEIFQKAYPDYDDAAWDKFWNETGASRNLVRTEVYNRTLNTETESDSPSKYFTLNRMRVPQGGGSDYVALERDIYKPMHEESIKQGNRTGWNVWQKWPGDFTNFQYVTSDAYASLAQATTGGGFTELFNKVHPGKDINAIGKDTNDARILLSTEMWRLVDGTATDND